MSLTPVCSFPYALVILISSKIENYPFTGLAWEVEPIKENMKGLIMEIEEGSRWGITEAKRVELFKEIAFVASHVTESINKMRIENDPLDLTTGIHWFILP